MSIVDQQAHLNFLKSIPQFPQKSEGWFNQRKGKLTSSDAATVLDMNPYKKRKELLEEKTGKGKAFTGNAFTLHGQKYEDEAIKIYERLMGKKNHDFGLICYADVHPIRPEKDKDHKYNFLGGSPDGIAEDLNGEEPLIMVEVKCPMRRKLVHGQIPHHYYPQVQLNMYILCLEVADFVEYIPADEKRAADFNIVRIYRDDQWLNDQLPKLRSFWEDVNKLKLYVSVESVVSEAPAETLVSEPLVSEPLVSEVRLVNDGKNESIVSCLDLDSVLTLVE